MSSSLDSFIGMASDRGVRFVTREDAVGVSDLLRANGVENSEDQFIALVGDHLQCESVPEVLQSGLTKEAVARILELMARVPRASIPPMCKLLGLACAYNPTANDFHLLVSLVACSPERVDDLIVLANERMLREEVLAELAENPGLLNALSLAMARELFGTWEPGDGSLLDFARAFSSEIRQSYALESLERTTTEPEPKVVAQVELVPQFDHTRLEISQFVNPRSRDRCKTHPHFGVSFWLEGGKI
jgi:hypothetical protein